MAFAFAFVCLFCCTPVRGWKRREVTTLGCEPFLGLPRWQENCVRFKLSFFYCDINCIENERSDCTLYASVLN